MSGDLKGRVVRDDLTSPSTRRPPRGRRPSLPRRRCGRSGSRRSGRPLRHPPATPRLLERRRKRPRHRRQGWRRHGARHGAPDDRARHGNRQHQPAAATRRARPPVAAVRHARLDAGRRHDGDICKALGLSRSTLYAACRSRGGVIAFIRQRRLERIHALLADPREHRRISEIAYQHGFTNAAHFSRSFRAAFGVSPHEARADPGRHHDADAMDPASAYRTWVHELAG